MVKIDEVDAVVTLDITTADFEAALGKASVSRMSGRRSTTLGESGEAKSAETLKKYVSNNLPKVLAKIVDEMIPEEFSIQSVAFDVQVKGAPLGVGINGALRVTMGPAKSSREKSSLKAS